MRNVIEIPIDDFYQPNTPGFKAKNAIWKIKGACSRFDVTEDFILMNDDFFFLEYTPHVDTYHLGPLLDAEKKVLRIIQSMIEASVRRDNCSHSWGCVSH